MKYLHVFNADWSHRDISKLELEGIRLNEFGIFQLTDQKKVNWVLKNFSGLKNFYYNKPTVIFSEQEIQTAKTLMLAGKGPNMVYSARLSKEDEGYDYLEFAFGDICRTCNRIPKNEQIRPLTLAKEPKLSKKYIWGSFHGHSGYLFTDNERYKILEKKWGLNKREVLIGTKQKVSKNFVQVDISIADSPLCFGNSYFGKTIRLDGSGKLSNTPVICTECNRSLYTNQILDYFPSFENEHDFNIVFTQEWFGWYRRLVVSKEFSEWLLENKFIKFNSEYLVPVRDFCK